MNKQGKSKKENFRRNVLRGFLTFLLIVLIALSSVGVWIAQVISEAPEIDPQNIDSFLPESTVIYDSNGNVLMTTSTTVYRENISISDMPENLKNAFIAIEDKTFYSHHGFNYKRILGALKEHFDSGDQISGTSTITQQLARNLYLSSERSYSRKIKEAYYAYSLEKNLSKDEILESYLNSISLGYSAYGVQAAAKAYFNRNANELTLAQCAVLASIPKSPSKYAPLKRYYKDQVAEGNDVIYEDDTYTTVYNPAYIERQRLVLQEMLDQGLITADEYNNAVAEDIRHSLYPAASSNNEIAPYFTEYCLKEVIRDFMDMYEVDESSAKEMVNKGGFKIYSTIDIDMQKKIERKFENEVTYPAVSKRTDRNGDILGPNKKVLLYRKSNVVNDDGSFTLKSGEYQFDSLGNIVIFENDHFNFTDVKKENGDGTVPQINFKKMYVTKSSTLYVIDGGYVSGFEEDAVSRDANGNYVISAYSQAMSDIVYDGESITIPAKYVYLNDEIIQPQSAMVVIDYTTGEVKAIVGGRGSEGKSLFNRADNPRQPGSSIKPIGVYAPALQIGADTGRMWTAGTIINDAEFIYEGRVWPTNWYSGYRGLMSLRTAVEQSVNVVAVKVLDDIGVDNSLWYLKRNGITTIVESEDKSDLNYAALALGGMTNGISPLEMASAYGTFPNGGIHNKPMSYTRIEDMQGNILVTKEPSNDQVYSEAVAFIMTDILRTTVSRGIAGKAAMKSQPVGGKTGTTTSNYDAWFVGFTPQYAASVWIGNDVNLELADGSSAAAAMWSNIMEDICSSYEMAKYKERPDDVYVSDGEYYVKGTQKTQYRG